MPHLPLWFLRLPEDLNLSFFGSKLLRFHDPNHHSRPLLSRRLPSHLQISLGTLVINSRLRVWSLLRCLWSCPRYRFGSLFVKDLECFLTFLTRELSLRSFSGCVYTSRLKVSSAVPSSSPFPIRKVLWFDPVVGSVYVFLLGVGNGVQYMFLTELYLVLEFIFWIFVF